MVENLHSFSYGSHVPKSEFINKKNEVEKFVHAFSHINPNEIKDQLRKLIENPPEDIRVENKEGKTMISGAYFSYQYRCY